MGEKIMISPPKLKKIYIPSGMIASMFNLYGGDGSKGACLSEFDIQTLCAYMEFYLNYTNIKGKKIVYRFYTLPQFYSAKEDDMLDLLTEASNNEIKEKYVLKVSDRQATLLPIAQKLEDIKMRAINLAIKKGLKKELDPEFDKREDPTIDYDNLARNPYEYGVILQRIGFRVSDLYSRRRISRAGSGKTFPVFLQQQREDKSTFFMLKPEGARKNIGSGEVFNRRDAEMRQALGKFFDSDSYKVFAKDKKEAFAPNTDDVIKSFKRAVVAFNSLGINKYNQNYYPSIEKVKNKIEAGRIGTELV